MGDESFFRDRFRRSLTELLDPATAEYCISDLDLSQTPLEEVLDLARTPSLLAPLQLFFLRNARELFTRSGGDENALKPAAAAGKKKHGDFPANVEQFLAHSSSPPAAVLVFIADHLHLPADRQRISLEDKTKLQRLEATLGPLGEFIYCGQLPEAQAATLAQQAASDCDSALAAEDALQLVQMQDGNLGIIEREVEKLALHAGAGAPITAEAIAALVPAGQLGSGFELASLLARGATVPCLACLHRIWAAEGDGAAIGLVFQLSRAFAMALILRQHGVRDRRGLYATLPEGLRPPGFAADLILAVSRNMPESLLRRGIELLHAADVELRSSPPSPPLIFERLIFELTRPTGVH